MTKSTKVYKPWHISLNNIAKKYAMFSSPSSGRNVRSEGKKLNLNKFVRLVPSSDNIIKSILRNKKKCVGKLGSSYCKIGVLRCHILHIKNFQ